MSSKIKVDTIENVAGSGNVSLGSGHNLVVPGDLTVDTSTLKVDSSNNRVGVGIASPTHPLSVNGQIKSTGSNGETVQLQTSSQYTGISFIGSDGTRDAIIDYDHTGGVMGIKAHTSAHSISMTTGGYTERLGINADGHVTMASQPYVTFQGSSGGNTNITHGEYFGNTTQGNPAFSTSGSNLARMQGITYNSSNGLFTVPTGGVYMIYFQGYYNASATTVRVDIMCNGVQMALGHMNSQVGTVGTSFAATLSANDTVGFRMLSGSPGTTQAWFMGGAHLCGYIVKVA